MRGGSPRSPLRTLGTGPLSEGHCLGRARTKTTLANPGQPGHTTRIDHPKACLATPHDRKGSTHGKLLVRRTKFTTHLQLSQVKTHSFPLLQELAWSGADLYMEGTVEDERPFPASPMPRRGANHCDGISYHAVLASPLDAGLWHALVSRNVEAVVGSLHNLDELTNAETAETRVLIWIGLEHGQRI